MPTTYLSLPYIYPFIYLEREATFSSALLVLLSLSLSLSLSVFEVKLFRVSVSQDIPRVSLNLTEMDEYNKRRQVPAFGSWDCHGDLPFTQCFESARQAAGLLRYSYSEDRDLYVAGDLYQNDVMTPAMIVVPRRAAKNSCYPNEKEGKRGEGWGLVGDVKEAPSPIPTPPRPTPKAVDEDLYKISPTLLRNTRSKRKRVMGFFSSCLLPTCVL